MKCALWVLIALAVPYVLAQTLGEALVALIERIERRRSRGSKRK